MRGFKWLMVLLCAVLSLGQWSIVFGRLADQSFNAVTYGNVFSGSFCLLCAIDIALDQPVYEWLEKRWRK